MAKRREVKKQDAQTEKPPAKHKPNHAKVGRPSFPAPPGLPARLRQAREEAGLSASDAAQKIEVDVDTWRSWERGETRPFFDDLMRAAELLNVNPHWLHRGAGSKRTRA